MRVMYDIIRIIITFLVYRYNGAILLVKTEKCLGAVRLSGQREFRHIPLGVSAVPTKEIYEAVERAYWRGGLKFAQRAI